MTGKCRIGDRPPHFFSQTPVARLKLKIENLHLWWALWARQGPQWELRQYHHWSHVQREALPTSHLQCPLALYNIGQQERCRTSTTASRGILGWRGKWGCWDNLTVVTIPVWKDDFGSVGIYKFGILIYGLVASASRFQPISAPERILFVTLQVLVNQIVDISTSTC